MHIPPSEPIGLQVIGAAQFMSGALDVALTAAGASTGMWLVLVAASGKDQRHGAHSELSEAKGVDAGTLSDDVDRMQGAGLVVRKPDTQDARLQRLELTDAGRALFHRLLRVVVAFDTRLRTGLTTAEIDSFNSTLKRLRSNVGDEKTS
jgi:MarR family transcriptional regulator, transcriptional regulator for hemolysin